jgi:hypothetical protein
MAKTDGGPAFPEARGGGVTPGMTLRDYFAGQAVIALMSNPTWVAGLDKAASDNGYDFKHALAGSAYALADEMLDIRNAGK